MGFGALNNLPKVVQSALYCAQYIRTSDFVEIIGHPLFLAQHEGLIHCCFTATSCLCTSTNMPRVLDYCLLVVFGKY